jgi:hypothetical protein
MSPTPQGPAAPAGGDADVATRALSRLVTALAEDAIFVFAGARDGGLAALPALAKRRADAYTACLRDEPAKDMIGAFDAWVIDRTRAMAPIAPPVWLPMGDVVAAGVTLEVGARGIRSLFSSKPSDKDVLRVKRLGTLAVRVLRAVFAADGNVDAEEARAIAALVASLGLPDADAAPLRTEEVISFEQLDVYGDVGSDVALALVRGAWLAAAWDTLDPREEHVVKTVAAKLSVPAEDIEAARARAIADVDARRLAGLATVDYVRFLLHDRVPGPAVPLAARAGALMLPRRYREEALAQIAHGAPVTLARRYLHLAPEARAAVLGIVWAAALHDDPSLGRHAILRARFDEVAADLAEDGCRVREELSTWIDDLLTSAVSSLSHG